MEEKHMNAADHTLIYFMYMFFYA